MKILVDTNVLISAALFEHGVARRALAAVVEGADEALVCDYSIDEINEVFARKLSNCQDLWIGVSCG